MTRVRGNKAPLFTLKIGAATATNFGSDVVSIGFEDGEGSQTTMADYATGTTPVAMANEFVLDFGATSIFQYLWDNAGAANVSYVFQRDSVAAVSQDNPKFTGTLTLGPKPRFAIEAGAEDDTTFEVTWQLDSWNKAIS